MIANRVNECFHFFFLLYCIILEYLCKSMVKGGSNKCSGLSREGVQMS